MHEMPSDVAAGCAAPRCVDGKSSATAGRSLSSKRSSSSLSSGLSGAKAKPSAVSESRQTASSGPFGSAAATRAPGASVCSEGASRSASTNCRRAAKVSDARLSSDGCTGSKKMCSSSSAGI
eukprot:4136354-Prymnesium_polylepis.1